MEELSMNKDPNCLGDFSQGCNCEQCERDYGEHMALLSGAKLPEKNELKVPPLRSALAGVAGIFGLALLAGGRSSTARAQDAATLVPILTEIGTTATSIYDTAMKYQKSFNSYVDKFNQGMEIADKTKMFADRLVNIDEVFLETKNDLENMVKGFSNGKSGDWTKLRLRKASIQSVSLARYFRSMSANLDSIESKLMGEAEKSNLKDQPAKLSTIRIKKESEMKIMRAEATLAATSQRQDDFRSLLSIAKNEKAKTEAQAAISSVSREELAKRQLEQTVLTNRLLMTLIEIQSHGRPLTTPDALNSADFQRTWTDIENNGNFDGTPTASATKDKK